MTLQDDYSEQLRKWYLARLRRRALADAANQASCTPAALIMADKDRLEKLILSRPMNNQCRPPAYHEQITLSAYPVAGTMAVMCCAIACCLIGNGWSLWAALLLLSPMVIGTGWLTFSNLATLSRISTMNAFLQHNQTGLDLAIKTREPLESGLSAVLTQLARLKEHQDLIADYAEEVTCILDPGLRILGVTPGSVQAWGISPPEVHGQMLQDLLVTDSEVNLESLFESGRDMTTEFSFEARLFSRDRKLIDTCWTVEWSHTVQLFFAVVRDISAQAEVDRIKNEMVAVVSHDLRAPIRSIQWTFRLLSQGTYGTVNDLGQRRLRSGEKSAEFLLDMIADLIDLHRIDVGKPGLVYSMTDLKQLVEESISVLRDLAEAKSITLVNAVAERACPVDSERMRRVLINLISNGIKFSPKNSSIKVEATRGGKEVTLIVSDQGKGIKPELLGTLFDRFNDAATSAARRDGSGLGLFASKAIVEAHGGRIHVESKENEGTKFYVVIPLFVPGFTD